VSPAEVGPGARALAEQTRQHMKAAEEAALAAEAARQAITQQQR
jgi:hypothetical protein